MMNFAAAPGFFLPAGISPDVSPPSVNPSRHVADSSLWRTPPLRPQGFHFEIQISSLGTPDDPDWVRQSISELGVLGRPANPQ